MPPRLHSALRLTQLYLASIRFYVIRQKSSLFILKLKQLTRAPAAPTMFGAESDRREMEDLFKQAAAIIRRIEAEAYARGKADAKAEMLTILMAGERMQAANVIATVDVRSDADNQTSNDERQRAPRGAARTLVLRAMQMSGALGIEPRDANDVAENDLERMVQVSSIRTELRRGRGEGRYAERGGRWFLAPSEEEAPAENLPGEPAGASVFK